MRARALRRRYQEVPAGFRVTSCDRCGTTCITRNPRSAKGPGQSGTGEAPLEMKEAVSRGGGPSSGGRSIPGGIARLPAAPVHQGRPGSKRGSRLAAGSSPCGRRHPGAWRGPQAKADRSVGSVQLADPPTARQYRSRRPAGPSTGRSRLSCRPARLPISSPAGRISPPSRSAHRSAWPGRSRYQLDRQPSASTK